MILLAGVAAGLCLFSAPYFAVTESSQSRPLAFLSGHLPLCVATAAALSAVAATAEIAAFAHGLQRPICFVVFAPPAIGAAPWAAGELCAGPSSRQDHAFAAALIAAYLAALLTGIASPSLLVRSLVTAFAATAAYLCTRGDPT